MCFPNEWSHAYILFISLLANGTCFSMVQCQKVQVLGASMIKFWCRPNSRYRQLTSPCFFMWMKGALWSLFYKDTRSSQQWELCLHDLITPQCRPLPHVGVRISIYEYQGDGFQYMNTRGTDLNIWIPGRQISVYEYQGDTNNQTQQWNNDFTYLCRILVILYVFIITEQGRVLSKCVCVHVCMYVHSLSPVYTNTYIFTIRLVQK